MSAPATSYKLFYPDTNTVTALDLLAGNGSALAPQPGRVRMAYLFRGHERWPVRSAYPTGEYGGLPAVLCTWRVILFHRGGGTERIRWIGPAIPNCGIRPTLGNEVGPGNTALLLVLPCDLNGPRNVRRWRRCGLPNRRSGKSADPCGTGGVTRVPQDHASRLRACPYPRWGRRAEAL